MLALINGGTIPNTGSFGAYLSNGKTKLGELDEEMVFETRPGENILLGATTWRTEEITRYRVIVTPVPVEPGKLPFWRGDGPGRPIELGRALHEITRAAGVPLIVNDRLDVALAIEAEGLTTNKI